MYEEALSIKVLIKMLNIKETKSAENKTVVKLSVTTKTV